MDPDAITSDAVHGALRAIRRARRLDYSPLLHLGVLRVRLRSAGRADSPEARAAELSRYLDEVVREALETAQGPRGDAGRQSLTPASALELLARDFGTGNVEREAWSTIYARYFTASRPSVEQMAERLGISARTIARRTVRGHVLLAECLREREAVEPTAAQHNIPYPLTRFIGREREIADVRALLVRHRLVTLTGVGGIGKSRLAMEMGRSMAGDYADGAWMVELGPVETPSHVVSTVATVFEVREPPRRELIDVLTDFFDEKHLLLILDNCEHLTEPCAELAETLLGRCADLRMLATSRERLHVQGECAWQVPPLSVPGAPDEPRTAQAHHDMRPSSLVRCDSVRLFTDRAMTAMPGFEITLDNAPHVAEVCNALDGIPLATELAASRVKMLSAEDLAARLTTPFELLRDGRRPTRPQHETLRATMDWSHALLNTKEQGLFRHLSVFQGGWTLEAAAAVCANDGADEHEILDLMHKLADKSLIVVVARRSVNRRYGMLQTVRQYALEMLQESGEAGAQRDRHLSHFVEMAETAEANLKGAEQRKWLALLEAERENLGGALRWAVDCEDAELAQRLSGALARFWELQGYFHEGRAWLAQCLAIRSADSSTDVRAKSLSGAGALAEEQADYDAAQSHHRESLAISLERENLAGVAESMNNLGNVAILRGDHETARAHHTSALAMRRELGDAWGVAVSLNNLGNIAEHQTDYDTARSLYAESAETMRSVGDQWAVSVALNNLGLVASEQQDYGAARRCLAESLAIARELDDRQGMAHALHTLGDVARRQEDHAEARRCHSESLRMALQLGDRQGVAESLESFAFILAAEGDSELAAMTFAGAHSLRQRIGAADTESERLERECALTELRVALGDSGFEEAWNAGSMTSEATAVARVVGEP